VESERGKRAVGIAGEYEIVGLGGNGAIGGGDLGRGGGEGEGDERSMEAEKVTLVGRFCICVSVVLFEDFFCRAFLGSE